MKPSIAIYLRVSTDKQLLDAQETAIVNWMAAHSIDESEVLYFKDEGISGAKGILDRPGLKALTEMITKGQIKTLVTFELSRLSRDYMDFLKIMDLCNRHKVSVQVPGDGEVRFDSNQDKLIASIKAFLAAEERTKISERTKAGLANARKKGVKLGRPPGTKTNKGHRKKYDEAMLKDIRKLTIKGITNRDIAKLLSGKWKLSPTTVKRLQQRYQMTPTA